MSDGLDWVKAIYQPLARRTTRRVICGRLRNRRSPEEGRFTRPNVDAILEQAWLAYDLASPGLPAQPTTGSTMNVHLACVTFSVFNSFVASGTEREYAVELVADATWAVYQIWAKVTSVVARFAPDERSALAFASHRNGDPPGAVSLSFPFNAPGYIIEPVVATEGIAFDVVRCPVGSYFREQGAADVCLATWCNLDYALGEMTGDKLRRTKTIVQGDGKCDFRIFPKGAGDAASRASRAEASAAKAR